MLCVDRSGRGPGIPRAVLRLAVEQGVAVFPSMPRAARAVEVLLRWRRDREGLPEIL